MATMIITDGKWRAAVRSAAGICLRHIPRTDPPRFRLQTMREYPGIIWETGNETEALVIQEWLPLAIHATKPGESRRLCSAPYGRDESRERVG